MKALKQMEACCLQDPYRECSEGPALSSAWAANVKVCIDGLPLQKFCAFATA